MRSDLRTRWRLPLVTMAAALLVNAGCTADDEPEAICVVMQNQDGSSTISCDDGTTINVSDGLPGDPGTTCTAEEQADGSVNVDCDDGSTVVIEDGADGQGCSTFTDVDGVVHITCDDGSESTVDPGEDGTSCSVSETDGVVTVACTDGTEATIENGEDGGQCTVGAGEGGVVITCDDGTTVNIDDGQSGENCTVSDDPVSGDVTIECPDGTNVTVTQGAEDATLVGNATLFGTDDSSGIVVTVEGTTFTATTDAAGDYTITDVPVGNYAVTFDAEGYISVRLANIIALPGINVLPDVVLRRTEVIANADVFAVDICLADDGTPTSYLWLEDYSLLSGNDSGGQIPLGVDPTPYQRPGENALALVAQGNLIRFDPVTEETVSLGSGVVSSSVHCSPDGTAIAFLAGTNLEPFIYGNLIVWADGTRTEVASDVSHCGLSWNPTSTALAFLVDSFLEVEFGRFEVPLAGELTVYERDDVGPVFVDYPVRCFDPLLNVQFQGFSPEPLENPYATFGEYEWSPNGLSLHYQSDDSKGFVTVSYRLADGEYALLAFDTPWDNGEYSPDGEWLIVWEDNFFESAAYVSVYDTSEPEEDAFQFLTTLGFPGSYFNWSPNSQYVTYTNGSNSGSPFDLRVWDPVDEGPVGIPLAVNMTNFTWTWAPDSSGVLFSALEPLLPVDPPAGVTPGASSVLAFWPASTQELDIYSLSADPNRLEAAYQDDDTGGRLVFVEYPDGPVGSLRLWEPGGGETTTLVSGGGYFVGDFLPPRFVWAPDGSSVAAFENNFGELVLHALDDDDSAVLTADGLSPFVPVQYNADSGSLIVYGTFSEDRAAGFPVQYGSSIPFPQILTEWDVSTLNDQLITDGAVYASYSADGGSVFVAEVDPEDTATAPKYDVVLWPTLGSAGELVDTRADLLSNLVHHENSVLYVQKNSGFPGVTRNGPYRLALP